MLSPLPSLLRPEPLPSLLLLLGPWPLYMLSPLPSLLRPEPLPSLLLLPPEPLPSLLPLLLGPWPPLQPSPLPLLPSLPALLWPWPLLLPLLWLQLPRWLRGYSGTHRFSPIPQLLSLWPRLQQPLEP